MQMKRFEGRGEGVRQALEAIAACNDAQGATRWFKAPLAKEVVPPDPE